jgi:hypothetical protein
MSMMPYQSLASQSNPCFRLFKKALASLFEKALAGGPRPRSSTNFSPTNQPTNQRLFLKKH